MLERTLTPSLITLCLCLTACGGADEGTGSDGTSDTSSDASGSDGGDGGGSTDDGGDTGGDDGGTSGTDDGGTSGDGGTTGDGGTGTTTTGGTTTGGGTTGTGGACGQNPAPTYNECPAECDNACAGDVCEIECVGEAACAGGSVTCPDGLDCLVICNGEDACEGGVPITCPPDHGCTVECTGAHSCEQLQVSCGAGTCDLVCGPDDGGEQTCLDATFECGTNDGQVTCESGSQNINRVPDQASTCSCEVDQAC